jgi:hypothetical protein
MQWPNRGVYFFFDEGDLRSDSGSGSRAVRVGTHALGSGSRNSLWRRLAQHAGSSASGGGNHRSSIFRLLVGEAMKVKEGSEEPRSWGDGSHPAFAAERYGITTTDVRKEERALEVKVSEYIRALPFLFVAAEDEPGPASLRGVIERNSIALLSNYQRGALDPASSNWLGAQSGRDRVRMSGLWNSNHVNEEYDPAYLGLLERVCLNTQPVRSIH